MRRIEDGIIDHFKLQMVPSILNLQGPGGSISDKHTETMHSLFKPAETLEDLADELLKCCSALQWNLRTTDTLGAGTSSVVERLSASGGFDKIN